MASWSELRAYIANNYKVAEDIGRGVRMIFTFEDGRSQTVFVTRYELMDGAEEWAVLESPVGQLGVVNLERVVSEAGQMVCGGVGIFSEVADPVVTLRHAIPLANLDVNEFERPLTLVTVSADQLEQRLTGLDVH